MTKIKWKPAANNELCGDVYYKIKGTNLYILNHKRNDMGRKYCLGSKAIKKKGNKVYSLSTLSYGLKETKEGEVFFWLPELEKYKTEDITEEMINLIILQKLG